MYGLLLIQSAMSKRHKHASSSPCMLQGATQARIFISERSKLSCRDLHFPQSPQKYNNSPSPPPISLLCRPKCLLERLVTTAPRHSGKIHSFILSKLQQRGSPLVSFHFPLSRARVMMREGGRILFGGSENELCRGMMRFIWQQRKFHHG